ncbi:MAG: InlB B-repeat-containing protein [Lachnospiraceae bacterium]|nr:InlB B-repeat-containing protein [Lachnospiraceae bacterium]
MMKMTKRILAHLMTAAVVLTTILGGVPQSLLPYLPVEPVLTAEAKPVPATCKHTTIRYDQVSNTTHRKLCVECGEVVGYEACEPQYTITDSAHQGMCKYCRGYTTDLHYHDMDGAKKSFVVNGKGHQVPTCSVCGYVDRMFGSGCDFKISADDWKNETDSCAAICTICGDKSPFHHNGHQWANIKYYTEVQGYTQEEIDANPGFGWNVNRSQHWKVCYLCGFRTEVKNHVWEKHTVTDDSGKKSTYKVCKICGYLSTSTVGTFAPNKMHDHEYEWQPVGAGYQRKFCKICGQSDGDAVKCSRATCTKTDKKHTYSCPECKNAWTGLHVFEKDGSSTADRCRGKCRECGYVGDYQIYDYDNAYDLNNIRVLKTGEHVFGEATKVQWSYGQPHQHTKKCVDCDVEITEECDLENEGAPNGFYYKPDPVYPGTHHSKVCYQCGNGLGIMDGTGESCDNYDYEEYSQIYHIKTCHDCDTRYKGKGFEKHNMVLDEEQSNEEWHYYYCDCGDGKTCGYTEKKRHRRGKAQKENVEWCGGTYYTFDIVTRCSVCGYEMERRQGHVGKKNETKNKVISDAGLKIRRPKTSWSGRSGWEERGIDPNLLSGTITAGNLMENMREHADEYVTDEIPGFDLADAVADAVAGGHLPDGAEARHEERDDDGNVTSSGGNTTLVLEPSISIAIADDGYSEENERRIRYQVQTFYDASLVYEEEGQEPVEWQILTHVALDVTDPIDLTVPVPFEFLYQKSVLIEQELEDGSVFYLSEPDDDGMAKTVSFTAERGIPGGSSFFTLTSMDHWLTHVEAVAPTRSNAGNIEYWACQEGNCEKRFRDVQATSEISPEDCVLAQLETKLVDVSYAANGGSGDMQSWQAYVGDTYHLAECTFDPPEGKKFDCWDLGFAGDPFVIADHDYVLTAQWIDENAQVSDDRPCTVTFDKSVDADEQVKGEMEPQVFQRGVPGQLNKNQYTRDGYRFYGWSRTGSMSDAIVDLGTATFYCDTELTAVWVPCYTIHYDKNAEDAQGEMEDQSVGRGVYSYLNKNQFTREGYQFIGWNIDPDATTVYVDAIHNRFSDGGCVAISEDKTLYAVWKQMAVVHFDKNDEAATGEMEDQYFSYSPITFAHLDKCKFKKDGYGFVGWTKTPTGTSVNYVDEYNYATSKSDPVTLYALWGKNVRFSFWANGGTGEMEDQLITGYVTTPLAECTFTRDGYEFAGWALAKDSTTKWYDDQANVNLKESSTSAYSNWEDKDLYALWKMPVTVHFDKNDDDATGTMADLVTDNLTRTRLTANTFVKEGYTFGGWALTPDAQDKEYNDNSYDTFDGDTTLYAVWHKNITVHYDKNADDATGTTADQTVPDRKYFSLKYNGFARTGYTFSGWALTPDATIPRYPGGFTAAWFTEDTTLYALWNKNVRLTYDRNGGTGTMAYQTMKDRTWTQINANTYTREGYTFAGWAPTPNASYARTSDRGYAFLTEDTTWYAVWKPETAAAVTATVAGVADAVKDLDPTEMTDAEKEEAGEAADAAVDAVLALYEMDGVDVNATVLNAAEELAAVEEAAVTFGTGAADADLALVVDVEDAPAVFAEEGAVKVTNALLNAYAAGVEDEDETTEDGDVAVTFMVGAAETQHEIDDAYDEDSAVQFSMNLFNVLQMVDENKTEEGLLVPVIVTLPIPAALRGADLTLFHYDETGEVKETIVPVISDDGLWATFAISGFSDFALVRNGNGDGYRTVQQAGDVASVTWRYRANGEYKDYITAYFGSFEKAAQAACINDYKTELPEEDQENFGYYQPAVIKLLDNVTVSKKITMDCDAGLELNLNGKTFTVAKTGELDGMGDAYPTELTIASTTPGTFTNNGTIRIAIGTWTGDTINIRDGEIVNSFSVDGGTINIIGGKVNFGNRMINNGGDAPIVATISGNAMIRQMQYVVYLDENGNIPDGTENCSLILNGGYYDVDPKSYRKGYMGQEDPETHEPVYYDQSAYVTLDDKKIEQYRGQTDWAADATIYKWRINGDGGDVPPQPVVTAPAAFDGLVYDGTEQMLVNAGAANGGRMLYAVTKEGRPAPADAAFSAAIPAETLPGTYTVHYYATWDGENPDTAKKHLDVAIAKKPAAVLWSDTAFETDGQEHAPTATLTGLVPGDDVTVTLSIKDAQGHGQPAKDAGEYTATAGIGGSAKDYYEFDDATLTQTFTIVEKPEQGVLWIEDIPDQPYTGAAVKPEPRVHFGSLLLTGADYTVSYVRNTNAADRNKTKMAGQNVVSDAPTVTVRGKGNYAGTATATFTISTLDLQAMQQDGMLTVPDIFLTSAANNRAQKGKTKVTGVVNGKTVTLVENKDYTLSYYKCTDAQADPDDPDSYDTLCGADEPGVPGKYLVRVTGNGNYRFLTDPADDTTATWAWCFQTITDQKKMISKAVLTAIPAQTYDPEGRAIVLDPAQVEAGTVQAQKKVGAALQPYTLEVKVSGMKLNYGEDKDYTLTYENNTEIGTATVTVTGTGNGATGYVGTKTATFKINGTALSTAKFDGFAANIDYTGDVIRQDAARLYRMNGKAKLALVEGVDYRVDYTDAKGNRCDPVEIGSYNAVYTGVGGYTGTVKKPFKITGRAMTNVKLKPADFSGSTGTDDAGNYYSASWDAKQKGFIYTGHPFHVAGMPADQEDHDNCGIAIEWTDPKNRNNKEELNKGTDYVVTYDKNVLPGTATVTFTGKGLYTGSFKKTFPIKSYNADETKNNLADGMKGRLKLMYEDPETHARTAWDAGERSFSYTKGGVKPVPVVTCTYAGATATLTAGTDYTLAWAKNTAVTAATATAAQKPVLTVTFKGAYAGKLTGGFTVTGADLAAAADLTCTDVVWKDKAGLCKTTATLTDKVTKTKLGIGSDTVPAAQFVYTYAENTTVRYQRDARTVEDGVQREAGAAVDPRDIIPSGTEISVCIGGKGAYAGSQITGSFYYVNALLTTAKVTVKPQIYTGEAIELTPNDEDPTESGDLVVKYDNGVNPLYLICGTNYEIESYEKNINKGTAKVTIKGISSSGYGGTKTVTFPIKARTMDYTIAYDGNAEGLYTALCAVNPDNKDEADKEEWYRGNYQLTGTMKEQTIAAGGKLTKNAFKVQKKNGIRWVNLTPAQCPVQSLQWTTGADGTGAVYSDGGVFTTGWAPTDIIHGIFGGRYTMYAKWTAK